MNKQSTFVMGGMIGYAWCAWTMHDMSNAYAFIARFYIGLFGIIGMALIGQFIERKLGGK